MKFSIKTYIRHVRRQKPHIQQLHAALFAGTITLILALLILYLEYGYWHTSYNRSYHASSTNNDETVLTETPSQTIARLWGEGKDRLIGIQSSFHPLTGGGTTFDRSATNTKE